MNACKNNKKFDDLIARAIGRDRPKFDFDKWKQTHKKEIGIFESQTAEQKISRSVWIFGIGRIFMKSPFNKLAGAAAILILAFVIWYSMNFTTTVYALTDVPQIIGQATKVIHLRMRWFSAGHELRQEFWTDVDKGRSYHYYEGIGSEEGPDGLQTIKYITENVFDGRFVMKVNLTKKTVSFGKLLSCMEEPMQRIMIDRISKSILPDIQNLDQYTKVGQEHIDGKRYDIWQREFRLVSSGGSRSGSVDSEYPRFRYEYCVSPASGDVGRMTYWHKSDRLKEWEKVVETDQIEIDAEPPVDIFLTESPAGYTLKNQKATADIVGLHLDVFRSIQGYNLIAPASFTLEDGSVLICWCGTHDSIGSGPDAIYENLVFGGDLPKAPTELFALMSYKDRNKPGYNIHYVGRHLMVTSKADCHYEWALYIPQREISVEGISTDNVAFIRFNNPKKKDSAQEPSWFITSFAITAQNFSQYIRSAIKELSDIQVMPAEMAYDNLLALAKQIRNRTDLFESSQKAAAEARDHIGSLAPVKREQLATPEQVSREAKKLIEDFYTAIVDGRNVDAIKMLKYKEPRASRVVTNMKTLPGIENIKVGDIYATEENALVITNEFVAYEGKSGRWAISVLREKGVCLIKDFNATSTQRMQKEIDKYLQQFPKARHFPEP